MVTELVLPDAAGLKLARITAAPVPSGDTVAAGDVLFEIETHKVAIEVTAESAGILVHDLVADDYVFTRKPYAFVIDQPDEVERWAAVSAEAKIAQEQAWTMLACDVNPQASLSTGSAVSVAKATEIAVLGSGAGNSFQATLGMPVGHLLRNAGTAGFFEDKILDLVVYEASRLLTTKKFRILNSHFVNGRIVHHNKVTPGISFDEGGRLTLVSIPDADSMDLPDVQDRLVDCLMRYVGRRLTLDEVTGATFTISDLTAMPLSLSVPLLPVGQAIIMAVIKDNAIGYKFSISYDHRVTEGLIVAEFARKLAERIRSYDTAAHAAPVPQSADVSQPPLPAACSFCEKTLEEETVGFRRRGLIRIVDALGNDALCCSSCWEGW